MECFLRYWDSVDAWVFACRLSWAGLAGEKLRIFVVSAIFSSAILMAALPILLASTCIVAIGLYGLRRGFPLNNDHQA
jgi:hypothetical protein